MVLCPDPQAQRRFVLTPKFSHIWQPYRHVVLQRAAPLYPDNWSRMDELPLAIVEPVVSRVVHRVTIHVPKPHSPAACRVCTRRVGRMVHIGSVHAPISEYPGGWLVVQRGRRGWTS